MGQRSGSDARGEQGRLEAPSARIRAAAARKLLPRYMNNTHSLLFFFVAKTPKACPAAILCAQFSYSQAFPAPLTRSDSSIPWAVPRAAAPRANYTPAPVLEFHRQTPCRDVARNSAFSH